MGLDLGKLVKAVRQTDLIVTQRYERWLMAHPETFPIPDHILKDVVIPGMETVQRDRTRSFSSSSAGFCHRRQVYDYLGVTDGKDTAVSPQLARIFANGTWNHLRTQVAMLQAGIIHTVEEFLTWPKMRAKGSVDGVGIVPDNHPKVHWRGEEFGFEFKTANSNVFRILKEEGSGKYRNQVARYMLMSGWRLFVIFVENKDNQETLEWVIEANQDDLDAQREELRLLNEAVDTKTLPKRLPPCEQRTGPEFRNCPYGGKNGVCVRVGAWPGV